MIGQLLGGYRVLERVGEGPNGTVWKAEHPALGNLVAIKVLPADLAAKPSDRERFERGSRAAARLNHSGIATVFGAEFSGVTPYIVSEFVDGDTVNALSARGPLSARQAVDLVLQAARALQYAHQQGVIHRDISGGNVMVTRDGHCKIVDFGIAVERDATRKTTQGTVLGTWAYMAPEALRDETVSEGRDTYALGVVLYQLLTGRPPFEAETFEGLVYRILNDDARPPSEHTPALPASLDRLVLRVLEKNPKLRVSLERFISELEALRASGALDAGMRRPRTGWGAKIDRAIGRLVRQWTTMAPSQTRKLVMMASVSVVSIGALGLLVIRALPQGPVKPKVASLAILPLFNESRESGFEHIGHGLAEHVAGRLGRLEGLQVQPYRKWVFGDAAELCSELKVEGVLEGAFSVEGGSVEARVDLVTADGAREVVARTKSNGFKQAAEDLAIGVARGLKARLTAAEEAQVAVPIAGSNEAFGALSTAADAHQRGDREQALRWYERAAELDPGLAQAYVGMGSIHYDRYFRGQAGQSSLDLAKRNFWQALALEPDNGGAERGLIQVHFERAERESLLIIAQGASKRGPTLDALLLQAWAHTLNEMPDLAVPLFRQVIEVDPLNDEARWLLVVALTWSLRFEDAVNAGDEYFRRFGDDAEIHQWVGVAHWNLGSTTKAAIHFQKVLELSGDQGMLFAAEFFWEQGQHAKAREIWQEELAGAERRRLVAPDNPRLRADLLSLHMRLNHRREALQELTYIDSLIQAGDRSIYGGSLMWIWAAIELWGPRTTAARIFRHATQGMVDFKELGYLPPLRAALSNIRELAPLVAGDQAHEASLRQRFGLPPPPSALLSQ